MFERLCFWWNSDKKYLLNEDRNEFINIVEEFRQRFKHLVNIIAEIIIPNLPIEIKNNLKVKIKKIIHEMQDFGLPCMKAKIAAI